MNTPPLPLCPSCRAVVLMAVATCPSCGPLRLYRLTQVAVKRMDIELNIWAPSETIAKSRATIEGPDLDTIPWGNWLRTERGPWDAEDITSDSSEGELRWQAREAGFADPDLEPTKSNQRQG